MKKYLALFGLSILLMTFATYAIEYPQFKSAVSTTGITANFDSVYSKADQLKMVHDVVEHDAKHIVWTYKDTGNWAIIKDDGTVVIASPSAFSLDIKNVLNRDLVRAKDLIRSIGGLAPGSPNVYYVDDPYLYRVIKYDFADNFDLKLSVPDSILQKALLTVMGSDYAQKEILSMHPRKTPGQHYYIDGEEVSGCDAVYCGSHYSAVDTSLGPGGISCAPSPCKKNPATSSIEVSVDPVDITRKITPGIHEIYASGIDNQHTMIIEAVTSPSKDEMILYNKDYTITINETRSSPIAKLYALIQPIAKMSNSTSTTPITNTTL